VYRVFPSCRSYFASAQKIQIHRVKIGDSGAVVQPFMHVGTYPTRNFATLEPSGLQLPLTGGSNQSNYSSFWLYSTGQVSDPIHHFSILQSPVFLINSRYSITVSPYYIGHLISRSYKVILPSSFNLVISRTLGY